MNANHRVGTRIVAGRPGPSRTALLAMLLSEAPSQPVSCILEGTLPNGADEVCAGPTTFVHVLAPGCPCCSGNLALRVTLARVLRHDRPRYLIIAVIDPKHQGSLASMLSIAPWDAYLELLERNAPSQGH